MRDAESLRWAITGASGQLGRSLAQRLVAAPSQALVAAWDHAALDVGDAQAVTRCLEAARPDIVVNAAAFTAVDRCESEPALAERANAEGPAHLARGCESIGARLVHVSTDYVFDGEAHRPYTESDTPAPRSVYGASKRAGEEHVLGVSARFLVLRTCWLFGPGRNFVRAMLEQAQRRRRAGDPSPLRVVDDQFGSPTYTADLAEGLVRLVEGEATGLYHLANQGVASWWELARESLDRAGFGDLGIDRVTTGEFPRPARRPAFSALDCSKAARSGVRLRGWRDAVAAYLVSEESPLSAPGGPE